MAMKNVISRMSRAAVLGLSGVVFTATTASANLPDAGEETGPGMSAFETITWFVLAPLAVWAIIWFLWSIPQWRRNARPVTGDQWDPKPSNSVVNR